MWLRSRPGSAFRPVGFPSLDRMASATPYGRTPGPAVDGAGARVGRARLEWVDLVKGVAILLVAVFHAGRLMHQAGLVGDTWIQANQAFSLLRMPVFFAASGLFLGSVVRRSWPELWRTRLSLLVWPFAVWILVRFAWFQVVPLPSRPSENDVGRLLASAYAPANGLWFLHALVLFTVLAKVTRTVPRWVQLGVAGAAAALLLGPVDLPWTYAERLGTYYVFFVGAGLFGPRLRAGVATTDARTRRGWIGALAGVATAYVVLPQPVAGFLLLPLGGLAVMAGFHTAAALSHTAVGGWLVRLGRQTLPIYVAHLIVLGGLTTALLAVEAELAGTLHEVWVLPAAAMAAVAVSLLVHRILVRAGIDQAYVPPSWFRGPRTA